MLWAREEWETGVLLAGHCQKGKGGNNKVVKLLYRQISEKTVRSRNRDAVRRKHHTDKG